MDAVDELIGEMLDEAVPALVGRLLAMPPVERGDVMSAWRAAAAPTIAAKGDVLRFGSARSGEVAAVFSALARGLAVLACAPGGVMFDGRHWCADHALCEQAAAVADRAVAAGVA